MYIYVYINWQCDIVDMSSHRICTAAFTSSLIPLWPAHTSLLLLSLHHHISPSSLLYIVVPFSTIWRKLCKRIDVVLYIDVNSQLLSHVFAFMQAYICIHIIIIIIIYIYIHLIPMNILHQRTYTHVYTNKLYICIFNSYIASICFHSL